MHPKTLSTFEEIQVKFNPMGTSDLNLLGKILMEKKVVIDQFETKDANLIGYLLRWKLGQHIALECQNGYAAKAESIRNSWETLTAEQRKLLIADILELKNEKAVAKMPEVFTGRISFYHFALLCAGQKIPEVKVTAPKTAQKPEKKPKTTPAKGFVTLSTAGQSFIMGDTDFSNNPQHTVKFTYNFQLGQHDVTQKEYTALMGNNPAKFKGENNPIENVSWNDAIKYCNKRSEAEGLPKAFDEKTGGLLDEHGKPTNDLTKVKGYRLLTEAEYEYAAKGGKKNKKYGTASGELKADEAVYNTDKTSPVGSKKPIVLDDSQEIYDLCGNVWKWCLDWYDEKFYKKDAEYTNPINLKNSSYRVLRGGSWFFIDDKNFRSSFRNCDGPDDSNNDVGFRLARTVE